MKQAAKVRKRGTESYWNYFGKFDGLKSEAYEER